MLQLIVLALALSTTDADTTSDTLLVSWEEDSYQYITGSETQCASPDAQTISVELSVDTNTRIILGMVAIVILLAVIVLFTGRRKAPPPPMRPPPSGLPQMIGQKLR